MTFRTRKGFGTFEKQASVPVMALSAWTRYFTPRRLSPPGCINGYRRYTAGGNPEMDLTSILSRGESQYFQLLLDTETTMRSGRMSPGGWYGTLPNPEVAVSGRLLLNA